MSRSRDVRYSFRLFRADSFDRARNVDALVGIDNLEARSFRSVAIMVFVSLDDNGLPLVAVEFVFVAKWKTFDSFREKSRYVAELSRDCVCVRRGVVLGAQFELPDARPLVDPGVGRVVERLDSIDASRHRGQRDRVSRIPRCARCGDGVRVHQRTFGQEVSLRRPCARIRASRQLVRDAHVRVDSDRRSIVRVSFAGAHRRRVDETIVHGRSKPTGSPVDMRPVSQRVRGGIGAFVPSYSGLS